MNTLIVNLYAGPGAGKSTGAAYLFYRMKASGINCEYITEFAKDKTWEHNAMSLNCQFYISGKQAYRIARVNGQVDVIVTDSPILLGALYAKQPHIINACIGEDAMYENQLNVFINRKKEYNPIGRNQTETEAKLIDVQTKEFLVSHNKEFMEIDGNEAGYEKVLIEIQKRIGEKEPPKDLDSDTEEPYPPYLNRPKYNA